jgi:hypothetical protein
MRRRLTGLLLALILLGLAVPLTLGCCFGAPPAGGPHPAPKAVAAVAAVTAATSIRDDCADGTSPAQQSPYIETSNASGARSIDASRSVIATVDALSPSTAATFHSVRRYGVTADDTGPPLWLSTCVSRT